MKLEMVCPYLDTSPSKTRVKISKRSFAFKFASFGQSCNLLKYSKIRFLLFANLLIYRLFA